MKGAPLAEFGPSPSEAKKFIARTATDGALFRATSVLYFKLAAVRMLVPPLTFVLAALLEPPLPALFCMPNMGLDPEALPPPRAYIVRASY